MDWFVLLVVGVIIACAVGMVYYGCSVHDSQLLGPSLVRGEAGKGRVALTFDDGPTPPCTDQILDILKEYGVTATFFVNGKLVERFPETLKRISNEGHTLGNHTYTHPYLWLKTRRRIERELDSTQQAVERVTGVRPKVFRAPYGVRWFGLFPALRARGMRSVQWSDTGFDWVQRNTAEDIASKTLAELRDGSVILLHDGCGPLEPGEALHSTTVAALPAIIEGVRRRGLDFVSVQEFLLHPSIP